MIEKVKKRSGRTEKFSRHKLLKSVHAALHWARKGNAALEEKITAAVTKKLKKKTADTEDIRKAVCSVLKKNRHHEVCDFYSLVWLHEKPAGIKAVIKRDGTREKFSPEKLFRSVQKGFKQSGARDGQVLQKVMHDILRILERRYRGKDVHAENIKEAVEFVLMKRRLSRVAKHYILYRYM